MRFVTISEKRASDALTSLKSMQPLVEGGEIRFDYADRDQWDSFLALPAKTTLPLIATARLARDGGRWSHTESLRRELLLRAAEAGFALVDMEEDLPESFMQEVRSALSVRPGRGQFPGGVIISHHSFAPLGGEDGMARLGMLFKEMEQKGEMTKLAVMLTSSRDLLAFTRFALELKQRPGQRILIGMGDFGVPVRIAYAKYGSLLTFCSDSSETPAPGQLSPRLLSETYRLDRLIRSGADYQLFGIIGNPVLHSRSPEIHNPGFEALGLDALYIPFPADHLPSFMETAELLNMGGISVTVPHKEGILPFLRSVDPLVREIGSCNTVLFGDGHRGMNTDYEGFLIPLEQTLGTEGVSRLASARVLVIGAGGVARTVLIALRDRVASIVVTNRNRDRAQTLTEELLPGKGESVPLHQAASKGPYELIVQTTPVGMSPDTESVPLPDFPFTGREMVYDLIYAPEKSAFLKQAEAAGCRILGGLPMLRNQAYVQFRHFTGRGYPLPEVQKGSFSASGSG